MSLSLNDLFYRWLQTQLPSASQLDNAVITPGSNVRDSIVSSSTTNHAAVLDPGINAFIATIGPVTGLYRVEVYVMLLGAPVAADCTNLILDGALRIIAPLTPGTVSPVHTFYIRKSNNTISVKTINAGTAGVTYVVTAVGTKIAD